MNGKRVAQLRREAGMSQQQFANAAGLSMATITDIERGAQINPTLSTIEALARALRVPAADLLADPEPMEATP